MGKVALNKKARIQKNLSEILSVCFRKTNFEL